MERSKKYDLYLHGHYCLDCEPISLGKLSTDNSKGSNDANAVASPPIEEGKLASSRSIDGGIPTVLAANNLSVSPWF